MFWDYLHVVFCVEGDGYPGIPAKTKVHQLILQNFSQLTSVLIRFNFYYIIADRTCKKTWIKEKDLIYLHLFEEAGYPGIPAKTRRKRFYIKIYCVLCKIKHKDMMF